MKKVSLLLGVLGGSLAGYLFSNRTLRKELASVKDAEKAAKILGAHLARDGKKIAQEVRNFVDSPEVQTNIRKAQKYAHRQFLEAKKQVGNFITEQKAKAPRTAKNAAHRVKVAFTQERVS